MSSSTASAADPLWNTSEASGYLGVAAATMKDWRLRGRGPEWVRLTGQIVRYRKSAIDKWLAEQTVEPVRRFGRR
ncbi:helix-turn-helix domain-containing protein [Gordonia sp. QH-12]|uniref:helix-turn-helix transcriptional regulator n=1 Tax=Gordonia sp. QH-12 TaxID=1437876 RepID=UPI0009ED68F9|nr:helix-turn-helix domain-containing protein [Gordonia sp. QH-12]